MTVGIDGQILLHDHRSSHQSRGRPRGLQLVADFTSMVPEAGAVRQRHPGACAAKTHGATRRIADKFPDVYRAVGADEFFAALCAASTGGGCHDGGMHGWSFL